MNQRIKGYLKFPNNDIQKILLVKNNRSDMRFVDSKYIVQLLL